MKAFFADVIAGVIAAVAVAFSLDSGTVFAQTYPSKSIKMLVGYSPGGMSDIVARQIGAHLEKAWNIPVVIENRPGAGGMIASEAAVRAEPDGHTLLYIGASISTFKVLTRNLPFDPLVDLTPVCMAIESVTTLATNAQTPAKTLSEFVAYAKKNPGKLNYGSAGKNSVMLAAEALKYASGIFMVEIPYPGEAQYSVAMLRNDVQFAPMSLVTIAPHLKSGGLRALAVIGDRRWPGLPDVQSTAEAGYPNIPSIGWYGVMAPGMTPKSVIDRLSTEIRNGLNLPEMKERGIKSGFQIVASTPEEYRSRMQRAMSTWAEVAKRANIKAE